ncbi:GNAT family N-acetyltransferase [Candidatus Clostridium radicumherbarum]|uniref:GNAT family N-acetyltransferase n=1 Tax=Candidatus Clostridium radicumherbarum TaxID=3381662 RepID=A0ABW8TWW5_9CLOT
MIYCTTGNLTIRSLERFDKALIMKWLSDNQVLKYYEGRNNPYDEQMVEEKFYNKNLDKTKCIIEYTKIPIGYIQFYCISDEQCKDYGYANFKGNIFGTDQFIGESKYWGKGIGKIIMKAMINFLILEKDARKIILDPQSWNERAIKCYEKCGFVKVKLLPKHELHEGEYKDCWLMEYDIKNKFFSSFNSIFVLRSGGFF